MSTEKSRGRNRQGKRGESKERKSLGVLGLWFLLPAFLGAGIWGMLAGCGFWTARDKGGAANEENVTRLRVIYSSGDIRWTGSMEWVAEQFMLQHPDIQVALAASVNVAGQSLTDRLKVMIAEDEFYDVVELREDVRFSEAGYLEPLPDSVTSLIKGTEQGEACYAVPRYTTTLGIIYNRDLFEELGLAAPESYEDFLGICETIKEAGISPVAVGGTDIWHMGFWGNYLYQNYILDEREESCWDRERIEGMLRDFRDLREKGYIDDRFAGFSDSQTVYELSSGGAAMVYSGPWIADQILGLNPQMELGFFYIPGRDGKTRAAVDRLAAWGISIKCREDEKRWQAAVDFLEFFYSEGIYEHVLAQMNGEPVTVRKVGDEETKVRQMVREAQSGQVIFCDKSVGDKDTPDGFRSFYDQSLQEVLWGKGSLEDIARELEERWRGGGH